MKIDAVEIYAGKPNFEYRVIRNLEVKAEARVVFSKSPTNAEADLQLRQLAASVGADAVIYVRYHRGVSMTSWNSLKATGVAVRKIMDELPCPVCAETIKKAAKKCRFCGAEIVHQPDAGRANVRRQTTMRRLNPEPLKSTDNTRLPLIILAIISGLFFLGMILTRG